jgi:gliding motility-associated-like protein
MRKQLQVIFFLSFGFFTNLFGQTLQVEEAAGAPLTPENLIYNYFLGEGIEVLSVKYDGPKISVGYFDKAKTTIGLERGIIMSTGRVKTMKNGNQYLYGIDSPGNVNADNNNFSTATDVDASKLTKEIPQNLVKYTITFRPTADTLRFRYVFASEEYPEYVCRDYNDLFGFFISGPGINGTFENKGINIAKIPGTDLPVTINNIHLAYAPNSCPALNAQYYHNNDKSTKFPVYDAYLDPFIAEIAVQPCQVYTIKLVIADIGDKRLDSGVFLDAKSFGTNAPKIAIANSTAVEGCSDATVTFTLPAKKAMDCKIPVKVIGGTATQNVDYKAIVKEVVIKAGQLSASLNIEAIKDATLESLETIGIEYQQNACEKDTLWLSIKDNELKQPELGADKIICKGESFDLDATVQIELPSPVTFSQNNSVSIATITSANPNDAPTLSEIIVNGIVPTKLQANVIQSVCFSADHERVEDLDVYLIAPNGKFLELTTDNGTTDKNYKNTCFSPKATKQISDGVAPFSGDFLPEGNFEDFWSTGDNPINGKWKLQITDDQAGQVGKLTNWNITFRPVYSVSYTWSPEDGLSCTDCPKVKATPSKPTTYKVIISDSYGCKLQDSMQVSFANQIAAPLVVCQEVTATSIAFTWQPVVNATEFEVSVNGASWQGTNGGTYSHKVNNLSLGQKITLQVRAKSNNSKCANGSGDIGVATCSTPDCLPPTLKIASIQNESCFGKKDGKIKAIASNGFSPYIYQFENQKNNIGDFMLLTAGTYTVTATDAKGCSTSTSFSITSPTPLEVKSFSKISTCTTLADGQAGVQVSGSTPPYQYSWASGKKDSLVQNLVKGLYSVTVYDKNSCSATQLISVEEKTILDFSAQVSDIKCYGANEGSITTEIKGGAYPYTYVWTGAGNFISDKNNINNLKSGVYNVTVADKQGCKVQKSYTITTPSSQLFLTVNGTATVCFGEKGNAQAFATGGTPPFDFTWSNGQKSQNLDKVVAGNYFVSVSDAKGCIRKDSVKIIGLDELKAEIEVTNVACHDGKDGSAKITSVTSANKALNINDLNYKWSNGGAAFSNTTLQGGQNYSVTISDKLGCNISKNISISNPASIGVGVEKITNATCFESANGAATVYGIGGTAPYSYQWDDQSGGHKTANTSDLRSGTYTVYVTDAKGCQVKKDVEIKSPNKLKISFTPRNLACKADLSGKVESFVVGGTAPYQYEWSTGAKNIAIDKLEAGVYRLTATDTQGCTVAEQTKLSEPTDVLATVTTTDLTCFGSKNGKISIVPSGGTAPYKFSLNGSPFNGISNIIYLKANVYDIAVKDVRGCLFQKTDIEINEPEALQIELGKDTTMNFGDTIKIGLFKKGFKGQTFKYDWNKRDSLTMSCLHCATPKIFPVTSTIYELKVTDDKGCTSKDNVNVSVLFSPKIFVPTGFSPNADGKNDALIVHGDRDIEVLYFVVYDKWGSLISEIKNYTPDDPKGVWDGTLNGKKLSLDTYVWGMEVLYPTGQKETMKGSVMLMR